MNKVTKDIMSLLSVDADTALRVQDVMECAGIDFSECTQREFDDAAISAFADVLAEVPA